MLEDEDLDALNARRGLRSVPRPEDSATVWSGLEDAEDTAPAEGTGTTAAGTSAGPSDEGPGTEDPDREAELEHSRGADDVEDEALSDPDTADLDAEAAPEQDAVTDRGDVGGEDPAASSTGSGAQDGYQDTVDLTPLPGFDAPAGEQTPPEKDGAETTKPAKKSKARSKRASMPSWDEIVFGSKHD